MVEQQELKSYELLSYPALEFHANDPRLSEMWYIVSEYTVYSVINVKYQFIEGLWPLPTLHGEC